MRVVVTGGSGQLGTLVLRRLCATRAIKSVVSIDLQPPRVACRKLEAHALDVRSPRVAEVLHGADALVHLAFVVTERKPRRELFDINVGGSRNVLGSALAAGVSVIVYSSSVAAYGVVPGHAEPMTEDEPRIRQDDFPYSAAKYDVEALLDELEAQHPGVAIARLRPGILVGTHMEHALGDLLRRRLLVDLGAPIPWVWDEDVADATVRALERRARGAFNLCAEPALDADALAAGRSIRVVRIPALARQALRVLGPVAGKLGLGRTDPSWSRAGGVRMIQSSERARKELGWRPRAASGGDVLDLYLRSAPRRLHPRLQVFFKLLALAGRTPPPEEVRRTSMRIHLALLGPHGGDVGLLLERGRLRVGPPPRPPEATVTLRAEALFDLLGGRLDLNTAQMTGKLRVEGEPTAIMLLGGIVGTLRAASQASGVRGRVVSSALDLLARPLGGASPSHATPAKGRP